MSCGRILVYCVEYPTWYNPISVCLSATVESTCLGITTHIASVCHCGKYMYIHVL